MKGLGFYGEDFFRIKEDNDLIRENISRILLTSTGERVMSNFGSRLKSYLFSPSQVFEDEVNSEIRKSIQRWEPRADVVDIKAGMDSPNRASISIRLVNKETLEPFTYEAVIRL